MSLAARRLRAGDLILASGSLLLIIGLLAHGSGSTAPKARRPVIAPVSRAAGPAAGERVSSPAPAGPARPEEGALTPPDPDEPRAHPPQSRTIQAWKDLPLDLVHRPHWLTGAAHRKLPHGTSQDPQLRNLEFQLELQGFDGESIQRGLKMVNRIDEALRSDVPELEPAARLAMIARGGTEAAALAETLKADGGEEAVRVRAIALLAGFARTDGVPEALLALAKTDASAVVRTAAGASLLWMGRQGDVAEWVETEPSSTAVSDFFDSIRSGKQVLDPDRTANVLVFRSVRVAEASQLVDVLMEGSAPSRWPAMTRAKMYMVATWYGREREDVADWMATQYDRATSDFMRASILFSAPELVHSRRFEDKAIEIARSGAPGLLSRTAVGCLGRFETERSYRALLEVIPRLDGEVARHAILALAHLRNWHENEIQSFLAQMAESHASEEVRGMAESALSAQFKSVPR
jgi:hypothetical protein